MPLRRTTKQSGELAELAFIHKAVSLGFTVSKPYGDSAPYDFVVGSGRRLVRVQVKSAHRHHRGAYYLSTSRRNTPYTRKYTFDEIDFIVGYIPPEDAWYVIPLFAVSHTMAVRVYPGRKGHGGRYERWRDRWDLLMCSRRRRRTEPNALHSLATWHSTSNNSAKRRNRTLRRRGRAIGSMPAASSAG